MTAYPFPAEIKPRSIMFHPQNASRSGGVSTNGLEQVVESGAGRWRASLTAPVATDAQILAWRAFLARIRGRANTILVPVYDGKRAPWPVDIFGRQLNPTITREPQLDGTAFESATIPATSAITAIAVTPGGEIGDRELTINVTQGGTITEGMYFGTGGNRLYLIDEVLLVVGALYTVTFWPTLREAVATSAAIELARPVCEMRFKDDDQGELNLDMLRWGSVSLDFVEVP